MSDRLTLLTTALTHYFEQCAQAEARKPPNELEIRRAQRAKEYWLSAGLVKQGPKPSRP